ncbi:IPT/TIG domain-containing protein [Heterostelium album PN500]|uniref:IPT/TIG domain-containing protein n=1 Tax=Heterostelium pallidum (strain ATCC 26659 / Pp 5 / PN500) TaxID=670386 RepID=D3BP34_HETP5|nr:IPT/TIG domain-containing protein [Heterostelium album PN500]EFA77044.1 IPT/TIG domain-containing protein [Heterostelium album PN500]|eukprot:XP_020429174.1 IPT/TIG domain-containing protein [Heterostelium album PN500]
MIFIFAYFRNQRSNFGMNIKMNMKINTASKFLPITNVTPSLAAIISEQITVIGSNFVLSTSITINTTFICDTPQTISSTQIICNAPALPFVGKAIVHARNPPLTPIKSTDTGFIIDVGLPPAPYINSIKPNILTNRASTNSLTITGKYFMPDVNVLINSTYPCNLQVKATETSLICQYAAVPIGGTNSMYPITTVNYGASSDPYYMKFDLPTPVFDVFDQQILIEKDVTYLFKGSLFVCDKVKISLDGDFTYFTIQNCNPNQVFAKYSTAKTLKGQFPAIIYNDNVASNSREITFVPPKPIVESVSVYGMSYKLFDGQLAVFGTGFRSDITSVVFANSYCTIKELTSTKILCQCLKVTNYGYFQLQVYNTGAGSVIYPVLLRSIPTITSFSPNVYQYDQVTNLNIVGDEFNTGLTKVYVGDVLCDPVSITSKTQLTCRFPQIQKTGPTPIFVRNTGHADSNIVYVDYRPPFVYITSIYPTTILNTIDSFITVRGQKFTSSSTSMLTQLDMALISETIFSNSSQIIVKVLARIRMSKPTITSITPSSTLYTKATVISIVGTGFIDGVTNVLVDNVLVTCSVTNTSVVFTSPLLNKVGTFNAVVYNGDRAINSTSTIKYYPPTPTLTQISPNSVEITSGTAITLTGTNFISGISKLLGNGATIQMTSITSTRIIFNSPTNTAVNVVCKISNAVGYDSNTLSLTFTTVKPVVTSFSPVNVTNIQSTSIIVKGSKFVPSYTISDAIFDNSKVRCTTSVSNPTTLTITSPVKAEVGPKIFMITNGNLVTNISINYVSPPITLTSITPNSMIGNIEQVITLKGTGFDSRLTSIDLPNFTCPFSFINSTVIICKAGKSTNYGIKSLRLKNINEYSQSIYFQIVDPPMFVFSIEPKYHLTYEPSTITINGLNFRPSSVIIWDGIHIVPEFVSETRIIGKKPFSTYSVGVVLITTVFGGFSATLPIYYVNKPNLINASPLPIYYKFPTNFNSLLNLIGEYLIDEIYTGTKTIVTFGNQNYTQISDSMTSISIYPPVDQLNFIDVFVTTYGQFVSNTLRLPVAVAPPLFSNLNPKIMVNDVSYSLTITGLNFLSGETNVYLSFGKLSCSNTFETIICSVPPTNFYGSTPVTVEMMKNNYTYGAITFRRPNTIIDTISPSQLYFNTINQMTVTGSKFYDGSTSIIISNLNAFPNPSYSISSVTQNQIIFDLNPFTKVGTYSISVKVDGSLNTNSNSLVVDVIPGKITINSINPNKLQYGLSNQVVTLKGSNFYYGTVIQLDSVNCQILSQTEDTILFSVSEITYFGKSDFVIVQSPQADTLFNMEIDVPYPVINSMNPSNPYSYLGKDIEIIGSIFTHTISVTINGINCLTIRNSLNSITITTPKLKSGTYQMQIFNTPEIFLTTTIEFIDSTPIIESISPISASINDMSMTNSMITIIGSQFVNNYSIIKIGSYQCEPRYIDETLIRCLMPEVTVEGELSVNVKNGEMISNTFHISYINSLPITSVTPKFVNYNQSNDITITITGFNFNNLLDSQVFIENKSGTKNQCNILTKEDEIIICRSQMIQFGKYQVILYSKELHSIPSDFSILDDSLACKSNSGKQVSWWFAKKLPQSQSYIYADSDSQDMIYLSDISSITSSLALTLNQIKLDSNTHNGYVVYNDHPWFDDLSGQLSHSVQGYPIGHSGELNKSLGKGILVAQTYFNSTYSPGFHIKHSMEGFPVPLPNGLFKTPSSHPSSWIPNDYHLIPKQGDDYSLGHSYMCHSFIDSSDFVNGIQSLKPFIYSSNRFTPTSTTNIFSSLFTDSTTNSFTSKDWSKGYFISAGFRNDIFTPTRIQPLSITLPSKFKIPSGANAITDVKLPTEFIIQNNIPTKISQWKSDIDKSYIAFNDTHLCLGDYSSKTSFGGGIAVCVINQFSSEFFVESIFKYQQQNCSTSKCENQIQNQFFISIKSKLLLDNTYSSNNNDLQMILNNIDSILPNTKLSVGDSGCFGIFCPITAPYSEIKVNPTDSVGIFSFRGSYTPIFNLILQDTNSSITIKSNGSPISYSTYNISGSFTAKTNGNIQSNNIIVAYKLIQIVKKVRDNLGFGTLGNIELILNGNGVAILNQHNDIPIKIDSNTLDVQSLFRAISYDLILQLNSATSSVELPELNFDSYELSKSSALLGGMINFISMKLRQLSLPNLPISMIQSMRDRNQQLIDIEHFTSSRMSRRNAILSQGWITSYLWDLVDQENDDYLNPSFRRPPHSDNNYGNQIDFKYILQTIQNNSLNSDILIFSEQLFNILPLWNTLTIPHARSIMIYNNIFECNDCKVDNPPTVSNSTDLSNILQSKGVCKSSIDNLIMPTIDEVQSFVSFWSSSSTNNWNDNQGISNIYSSSFVSLYNNSLLLESLIQVADPTLCEFQIENGYPVTPKGLEILTRVLVNQINIANKMIKYNEVSTYFVKTETTKGLTIITYKNYLCAFDIVDESSFDNGQVLSLCPSGPIVTSITGNTGPTHSNNNAITLIGRKLSETGVQVQIGSKNCSIQSQSDSQLICQVGQGVGTLPIIYFNVNTKLPNETPLDNYVFQFNQPVITSLSTNSPVKTYGQKITVYGNNFGFTNDDTTLFVGDIQFNIETFSTSGNSELLIFTSNGTGYGNIVSVYVGDQNSELNNQFTIDYNAPVINSISVDRSPTYGGGAMTVSGTSFGLYGDISIKIGSIECSSTIRIDDNAAICIIPPHVADHHVTIVVGNQFSSEGPMFKYDRPVIFEVLQTNNTPTSEPSSFWIIGKDLGPKGYEFPYISYFLNLTVVECDDDYTCYYNKTYTDENDNDIPIPTDPYHDGYFDAYVAMNSSYRSVVNFDCIQCVLNPGIGHNIPVNISYYEIFSNIINDSLSFNRPTILNVTENQSNTDGGAFISIIGFDFVPNEINETIDYLTTNPAYTYNDEYIYNLEGPLTYSNASIAQYLFNNITFVNSTLVTAQIPPGIGANHTISLFIGGQNSTQLFNFSYNAPNISSISYSDTIGQNITLSGCNFVPKNVSSGNSSFVLINGTECQSPQWISSNTINCTAYPGIGKNLTLTVSIGAQNNTDNTTFSYNPPNVNNVTMSKTDGEIISIIGDNFVPANIYAFKSNVTIFNDLCDNINWINENNITCTAKAGIGKNLTLSVIVGDQQSTNNNVTFSYLPPTIKNNVTTDTKGGSVIIEGTNFVPQNIEPKNSNITINDNNCQNIEWRSSSSIKFDVPPGIGNNQTFVIFVGNQTTDQKHYFDYNKPKISSISKSKTDGEQITLAGTNFVPLNVEPRNSNLTIGTQACNNIVWSSDTQILCTIPKGIGKSLNVTLFVGNQTTEDKPTFDYIAPSISSVTNSKTSGESITLQGSNFVPENVEPKNSNITINKNVCKDPVWTSSSQIICTAPSGIGKDLELLLFVGNQSTTTKFTYKIPKLDDTKYKGNPSGGDWIIIKGENFIPSDFVQEVNQKTQDSNNSVSIADKQCQSVEWVDFNTVKCQIPSGTGKDKNIKVTVGTQSSENNQLFSYNAPVVESISPDNGEQSSKKQVTINGINFGSNPTATIGDAGECQSVVVLSKLNDKERIQCNVPEYNTNGAQIVSVTLDGQKSNETNVKYTYNGDPKIDSISPTSGSVDGNFEMTVSGKNFKNGDATVTVYFNSKSITPTSKSTDTIKFTVPEGGGTSIALYIKVGNSQSNTNNDFSYDAPKIISITPDEGPYDQETSVSISGSNLGLSSDSSSTTITVGGKPCSMSCTVPRNEDEGEVYVQLTFKSQSASTTFKYTKEDSSSSSDSSDSSDSSHGSEGSHEDSTTSTTASTTGGGTDGGGPGSTGGGPGGPGGPGIAPPIFPAIGGGDDDDGDHTTGGTSTTGAITTGEPTTGYPTTTILTTSTTGGTTDVVTSSATSTTSTTISTDSTTESTITTSGSDNSTTSTTGEFTTTSTSTTSTTGESTTTDGEPTSTSTTGEPTTVSTSTTLTTSIDSTTSTTSDYSTTTSGDSITSTTASTTGGGNDGGGPGSTGGGPGGPGIAPPIFPAIGGGDDDDGDHTTGGTSSTTSTTSTSSLTSGGTASTSTTGESTAITTGESTTLTPNTTTTSTTSTTGGTTDVATSNSTTSTTSTISTDSTTGSTITTSGSDNSTTSTTGDPISTTSTTGDPSTTTFTTAGDSSTSSTSTTAGDSTTTTTSGDSTTSTTSTTSNDSTTSIISEDSTTSSSDLTTSSNSTTGGDSTTGSATSTTSVDSTTSSNSTTGGDSTTSTTSESTTSIPTSTTGWDSTTSSTSGDSTTTGGDLSTSTTGGTNTTGELTSTTGEDPLTSTSTTSGDSTTFTDSLTSTTTGDSSTSASSGDSLTSTTSGDSTTSTTSGDSLTSTTTGDSSTSTTGEDSTASTTGEDVSTSTTSGDSSTSTTGVDPSTSTSTTGADSTSLTTTGDSITSFDSSTSTTSGDSVSTK